jgi:hypothetical protein
VGWHSTHHRECSRVNNCRSQMLRATARRVTVRVWPTGPVQAGEHALHCLQKKKKKLLAPRFARRTGPPQAHRRSRLARGVPRLILVYSWCSTACSLQSVSQNLHPFSSLAARLLKPAAKKFAAAALQGTHCHKPERRPGLAGRTPQWQFPGASKHAS